MTKEEVIREIRRVLEANECLYKSPLVNYKGKIIDGNEKYIEVIAGHLLQRPSFLNGITELRRKRGYKVEHNIDKLAETSIRLEELFASKMKGKNIQFLGKVIDFQVPLKPSIIGYYGVGKIDILTKSHSKAYIVELKYGNNQETLLRAVLEIAYYDKWLWKEKFINDFENDLNGVRESDIKKAVLLGEGTRSWEDSEDLRDSPNLKKLIDVMDVKVLSINQKNEVKVVI